ncbi:hypothetical protein [Natrarchaeobius chitinivorans]|uniref:hypothetical protein n=1 Tax=Natrarchaeobius chitinivorans TaxID=1679083 RepID=UPI000F53495D|nr:hypothetical protein [Natrarchaeobius chitinivorans]
MTLGNNPDVWNSLPDGSAEKELSGIDWLSLIPLQNQRVLFLSNSSADGAIVAAQRGAKVIFVTSNSDLAEEIKSNNILADSVEILRLENISDIYEEEFQTVIVADDIARVLLSADDQYMQLYDKIRSIVTNADRYAIPRTRSIMQILHSLHNSDSSSQYLRIHRKVKHDLLSDNNDNFEKQMQLYYLLPSLLSPSLIIPAGDDKLVYEQLIRMDLTWKQQVLVRLSYFLTILGMLKYLLPYDLHIIEND